jgi:hypothetical protein
VIDIEEASIPLTVVIPIPILVLHKQIPSVSRRFLKLLTRDVVTLLVFIDVVEPVILGLEVRLAIFSSAIYMPVVRICGG